MNSLNSILLEGNLTRAPEARQTPKGTQLCTFTVASNRFYQSGEGLQKEVSYFDVETWAALAERCAQDLDKGRGVRVVGRLKQERWLDNDGQNKSKIKIVAEHVEFKPVFNKDGTKTDDKAQDKGAEDPLESDEVTIEHEEAEAEMPV